MIRNTRMGFFVD